MAFVNTTANIIPISISDFIPDFTASINANNDEFKRLIENLYNNLEISTDDRSMGSVSGMTSIYSKKIEVSGDSNTHGLYLTKTNNGNRDVKGSIVYDDTTGSIFTGDKFVVRKEIDASAAAVSVKSLSVTDNISFGSSSILVTAGLLNAQGGMAESVAQNIIAVVEATPTYNGQGDVTSYSAISNLNLTKLDPKNIFLIVKIPQVLYNTIDGWNPLLTSAIRINLNITDANGEQFVDGQSFSIVVASIVDFNDQPILDVNTGHALLPANNTPINLYAGANLSNSNVLQFTDKDIINAGNYIKIAQGDSFGVTKMYKTNLDIIYVKFSNTDERLHVKNIYNPIA